MGKARRMVSAGEWPRMFGDPRSKEEDQDPDFRALASLALGMAGLFMKNTYFSWGALFMSVSAMCCMVHPEVNMKQATTALMFSFSGLASSYTKMYQTRNAQEAQTG